MTQLQSNLLSITTCSSLRLAQCPAFVYIVIKYSYYTTLLLLRDVLHGQDGTRNVPTNIVNACIVASPRDVGHPGRA